MTPKDREEYVRSRCLSVDSEPTKPEGMWITIRGEDGESEFCDWQPSKDDAWSAAYAFTKEREEQIRLVEEEIAFLDHTVSFEANSSGYLAFTRILVREHAALAELKKGMRQ